MANIVAEATAEQPLLLTKSGAHVGEDDMKELNQIITTQQTPPPACCVWMDAGVVNYKLCDRGFDCDRCPLDQALHGRPSERSAHVESKHTETIFRNGR
jgi:hypothetical protein